VADNTAQNGSATIAADDVATLNGVASSGVLVQRVKPAFGDDGDARDVSHQFPLPVQFACDVATVTSVAASTTSQQAVAANVNRRGLTLHNGSSSATAYIRLGGGTAASTAGGHSFDMQPSAYFEAPFGFTGAVQVVWASATGFLNVTELT